MKKALLKLNTLCQEARARQQGAADLSGLPLPMYCHMPAPDSLRKYRDLAQTAQFSGGLFECRKSPGSCVAL